MLQFTTPHHMSGRWNTVGATRQHAVGFGMAGDVAGVQRTGEAVVVEEVLPE